MPSNKNVELGGRDGFKYFKHGVSSYMFPKVRRIMVGGGSRLRVNSRFSFVSQKLFLIQRAASFVTR